MARQSGAFQVLKGQVLPNWKEKIKRMNFLVKTSGLVGGIGRSKIATLPNSSSHDTPYPPAVELTAFH